MSDCPEKLDFSGKTMTMGGQMAAGNAVAQGFGANTGTNPAWKHGSLGGQRHLSSEPQENSISRKRGKSPVLKCFWEVQGGSKGLRRVCWFRQARLW